MLLQALLINAVVLAVVLESDLGPHRKITRFRVLRPLLTSLLIVPFFVKGAAGSGTGLAVEVILTVAGLLLALLAMAQMKVYLSPRTGRPATRAGLAYALVWTVVIGARTAFSYGSEHWFAAPLGRWLVTHHVTGDALTDALIFMAVAMVLTRVTAMSVRSRAVRRRAAAAGLMASPAPAAPAAPAPGGPAAPAPGGPAATGTDAGARSPGVSGAAVASGLGRAVVSAAGVLASRRLDREDDRTRRRAARRGRL